MAVSLLQRMDPFDCEKGDLDYYLEQFDHFLALNSLADQEEKKVPLFIASIGQDGYRKLKEVCGSEDPKDKSFAELVQLLQDYFAKREFYRRNQKPGEYLGAYINQLKRLQEKCNFGSFAKEALRDRIACGKQPEGNESKPAASAAAAPTKQEKQTTGTKPKQAKQPVPTNVTPKVLTLPEGWEIIQQLATTQEGGNKKSKEVVKKGNENAQPKAKQPKQFKCKICGHLHKAGEECPHKDASCFLCRKKGHIASVCREKNENNKAAAQPVQVHVHVQQNTAMKNE